MLFHHKNALKNADDHARHQAKSLTKVQLLGPSRSTVCRIQDPLVQHLSKDLVVDLLLVVMEELGRPNTPSKDLVVLRAVRQRIVMPASLSLGISSHLDPPLQHTVGELSRSVNNTDNDKGYNLRTHTMEGWVVPSTEERGGERTSLDLSNGSRTSIKTIGVAGMVAGDTRVHFWLKRRMREVMGSLLVHSESS